MTAAPPATAIALMRAVPDFWKRWSKRFAEKLWAELAHCAAFWLHPGQHPPPGDWRVWMMLAGRGFGKTFAGAHWVHERATEGGRGTRIALVGATLSDVREVMIEGESGLLATAPTARRPVWLPTRGVLIWPNGATASVYSGESPDGLRGPQHDFAWCDELAKWPYPQDSWDNLMMGLRSGDQPQAIVTTTPRNIALIRALKVQEDVVVTGGGTADNGGLPRAFRRAMLRDYGGTRLGRQELDGELIEDVEGALWTRDMLEACRVRPEAGRLPDLVRVVIGVDPPATATGDACGIIVAGLGRDGHCYVIEDASVARASPQVWAAAVAQAAARHHADRVVAEGNNGGDMVTSVLRAADAALPVVRVNAQHSKSARAEPVSLAYARGEVHHLGAFPALEDELCGMLAGGGYEGPGRSPDRADGCVWAVSEAMAGRGNAGPRVRVV